MSIYRATTDTVHKFVYSVAIGTPLIIEQPEKEVTVATPGKSVLLPCKADGFPKPSIYWLKDGTRVKFNERVMQSADGSLVILNMEHSDEGIYSCLVANTFGTKDVSVRLYLSQGLSMICLSLLHYCVIYLYSYDVNTDSVI